MRKITGFGAVLLGGVGVILCIVVDVKCWLVSRDIAERADRLLERTDRSLARVDESLHRFEDKVTSTLADLEEVKTDFNAEMSLRYSNFDREQLDKILETLTPKLERADSLAESLVANAVLLQNIAEVMEHSTEAAPRAEDLRQVADKLTEAAEKLNSLHIRAEHLQEVVDLINPATVSEVIDGTLRAVGIVEEGLSTLQDHVTGARKDVAKAREEVAFWKVAVPTGVTVILLWVALGQLCLIGWGRRRLTTRS